MSRFLLSNKQERRWWLCIYLVARQYMSIIVAVFSIIGDIASVICAVVAIVESVRENHHDKT